MAPSDTDLTSIKRLAELGSPVVSDALLDLGYENHIADPGIRPVSRESSCAGPVRVANFEATEARDRDFVPLAKFVDSVQAGEVLVLAGASNAGPGALWGDLLCSAAEEYQAAGVVIDGLMRDELTLEKGKLPVFSRGAHSRDALLLENITSVDAPAEVGGVAVKPGDIVVADIDGVVFFDASLLNDVLEACETKAAAEDSVRDLILASLRNGGTLHDAVTRIGVL